MGLVSMTEKFKKRRPVVAAILSLGLMGLGQLYNGQFHRAIMYFAIEILSAISLFLILVIPLSFQGIIILLFGIVIYFGIRIFAILDAFIGARRIGSIELQRYNRWYVYLSVFLVAVITVEIFNRSEIRSEIRAARRPFSIPSGGMSPTLLVGDYLFVDGTAYRQRPPERGDIAVFKLPRDNSTDYVKRIIGLPGDKIQMTDGVLSINGEAVKRERVADYIGENAMGTSVKVKRYNETLPNGASHFTLDLTENGAWDTTGVYEVPPGHYFMMGDNRDNSTDSRFLQLVGYVPAENFIGRAEVIYFSVDDEAAWAFWRWPWTLRFERIGNKID